MDTGKLDLYLDLEMEEEIIRRYLIEERAWMGGGK